MKKTTFLLLIIFSLSACNPNRESISSSYQPVATSTFSAPLQSVSQSTITPTPSAFEHPVQNNCLPPVVVAGYYMDEKAPTPVPHPDTPPIGWSNIPNSLAELSEKPTFLNLLRPQENYDEIWVSFLPVWENNDPNNRYFVYRTDTGEWRETPRPPYSNLFLDEKFNVWVAESSMATETTKFHRLDEEKNEFIFVFDATSETGDGHIVSPVKVDSTGVFWFIFRDENDSAGDYFSLYSFDPIALDVQTYAIEDNLDAFVIDKNDILYLLSVDGMLYKFNPVTGDVVPRKIYGPIGLFPSRGNSMYIDSQERLWIGDKVRYDQAVSSSGFGNPYILIPSPIFIEYNPYFQGYSWIRPKIMLESIDGRMWYNGDTWFDPDTGIWCRFTTYSSNIVEDSEHNLWMIADGKLYKYPLKK